MRSKSQVVLDVRGAGLAQWLEHSPSTNVARVLFLDSIFLLVLVLAPRGFSPGTLVFPSPQKLAFANSNSIWIIVKHFIMSLWLGRLRKHSPCY